MTRSPDWIEMISSFLDGFSGSTEEEDPMSKLEAELDDCLERQSELKEKLKSFELELVPCNDTAKKFELRQAIKNCQAEISQCKKEAEVYILKINSLNLSNENLKLSDENKELKQSVSNLNQSISSLRQEFQITTICLLGGAAVVCFISFNFGTLVGGSGQGETKQSPVSSPEIDYLPPLSSNHIKDILPQQQEKEKSTSDESVTAPKPIPTSSTPSKPLEPVEIVNQYHSYINDRKYDRAKEMLSEKMQEQATLSNYFANNVNSINVELIKAFSGKSDRFMVRFRRTYQMNERHKNEERIELVQFELALLAQDYSWEITNVFIVRQLRSSTNIRKHPGINSPLVRRSRNGELVLIRWNENQLVGKTKWYKVYNENAIFQGWVHGNLLVKV